MQKAYLGSTEPISKNTVGSANVAGTRFENISNPYSELPRSQTPWDRLVNWFGFRSGYDKAQEQYNLAGAEYNAQLEQLASEEKYNSPAEQAQRMREAGLNPDLTGVSGEPASEFDNQQESPDVSAGLDFNPLDIINSIGHGFIGTISGTIGILQDMNLLNQSRIALDSKDLEFSNQMIDFFKNSDSYFRSQYDVSDNGDLDFTVSAPLLGKRSPLFHSNAARKRFNKFRGQAENSLLGLTQQFKSYDDFLKSATDFGTSLSKPYISGFASLTPSDIAQVLRPLSKAQFDLTLAQVKADNAKAYKDYHKDGFEGDAYADLNNNPNNAKAFSESLSSGFKADTAENQARQSIAPLTVTKNKIIGRMLNQIEAIPDKSIGMSILKFFLVNQLSQDISPLQSASTLAGIAKTVSKL